MKHAAIYSALLHILLIALLLANLENPFASKKLDLQTISVDFVTIGEKTAAPRLSTQPESLASAPSAVPEKKPEAAADQPPEERMEESLPEPEKVPEKIEEKPKPEEKTSEAPKPEAVPIEKPKPPKKPEPEKKPPKPKPKAKKAYVNLDKKKKSKKTDKDSKKKKEQSLNDLLDDVAKNPNASEVAETDAESDSAGAAADSLSSTITASEIDGIRNKIRPCWRNTSGRDIIVTVEMELTKDGYVTSAKCSDITSSDPHRRAAAEQAVAAVLDPQCQPLPFPPEKYETWKHIRFNFNPKDMMR